MFPSFALLNPPLKQRKGKAAKRRAKAKRWFRKPKRLSSVFTPGGGVIRRIAANRRTKKNSFLGVNPTSRRHGAVSHIRKGVQLMARRHRRNGSFLSASKNGMLAGLNPKTMVGVAPILAGVVANGLATAMLSKKIPYTSKGIGNIALGLVGAGLLGMLGRHANKKLGDGIFVGGVVGTLGCAFQRFMKDGVSSLALGDDMEGLGSYWPNERLNDNIGGLGNFTTPQAIAAAMPSAGAIAQYSLPNTNAHFGAKLAPPQTPMQAATAGGVSDYEQGEAIGAVLGNSDDMSGIM